MPVHVYAVTRADHPLPDASGVGSAPEPVRLVRSGPLAGAVSDVPEGVQLTENDAATHLDVLVALLEGGPVLPIQFGTLAPDDDAVRTEILAPAGGDLERRLDGLDGLVEVHLDVQDQEQFAIREIVAADPGLRGAARSRDLGSLLEVGHEIGARLVQRREEQAEIVLARLRPLVVRDTPRSLAKGPEDPVLRWAFLVESERISELDDEVARLRTEMPDLAFSYVGPLPAMSFLEENLEPESTPDRQYAGFGSDRRTTGSRWGW